ncbi:TSUP family transporter [Aggregicoccus sp. 17bor-14]|uniref:TSUP family transporter n=1 Tax=Myxococcaceae TaxID=31 RepID=UPI00129C554C|nr:MULTISPECIES: TSUP family transporter [Myxococcaceae]MBF5045097.1 TSUP family transporter [Simulacricoccus sp. 17bor-14]MRI90839.1 TSUP family transporter [Aggregicoccus sp. 17bor-14]
MHALAPLQLLLLCFAALCAGIVDAIAGGGGLITLPVLLSTGLPPHLALGTNKGQSVFGSFAALVRFSRGGMVDGGLARWTFPLGLVGSLLGAALVLALKPEVLKPLVLVLLIAVAVFLTFRRAPPPGGHPQPPRQRLLAIGALVALAIGAYDGFFGPGTGTFLIIAFSGLLGRTLSRASADAKVVNFASNLAAVGLFASRGVVLWQYALPMAAAQFTGAWIGAHLAVRGGDRFVRIVVLGVVLALVLKLGHDVLAG